VWDKMTPQDQDLFKRAGQEWVKVNIKEDTSYSVTARTNMEKSGVKFYDMDDAGKQSFAKMMGPVYADFEKVVGASDWKTYQDEIVKTRK